MKFRTFEIVVALIVATGLIAGIDAAQTKPDDKAPAVDARAAQALQQQAAGYLASIAVLQKEVDAIETQFQREVVKLQQQCAAAPGYDLGPALTCVKKPAPKQEGAAPKGGGGM